VRLRRNGFGAILPGIESWFDLGNKSKTRLTGIEKVRQVADQVNTILRYVPYVRTNFVFGLDMDHGPEPFELTKRFLDLTPAAFPSYSLLSAFGRAAPLNLEYQRAGRVLPFPFQLLDNHQAMNVRPKNYQWPEFYDHVVDLTRYSFSPRLIARRFRRTHGIPRWVHLVSAISSEGFGRMRYHSNIRRLLDTDPSVRRFMEGETDRLPEFYQARIKRQLGAIYPLLPAGALTHDHGAYLKATAASEPAPVAAAVQIQPRPGRRRPASGEQDAQLMM